MDHGYWHPEPTALSISTCKRQTRKDKRQSEYHVITQLLSECHNRKMWTILAFVIGTQLHVDIYTHSLKDRTMDLCLLDLLDFILRPHRTHSHNMPFRPDVLAVSLLLVQEKPYSESEMADVPGLKRWP